MKTTLTGNLILRLLTILCLFNISQVTSASDIDFIWLSSGYPISLAPGTPSNPTPFMSNMKLAGNPLYPGDELGQTFRANTAEATVGLFLESDYSCQFSTTVKLNLYVGEGTDPMNLIDSQDVEIPPCFRGFVEQDYRVKDIFFTIGEMYTISVESPADALGIFTVVAVTNQRTTSGYMLDGNGNWVPFRAPLGYKLDSFGYEWPIYDNSEYGDGDPVINGVVNALYVDLNMTEWAHIDPTVPNSKMNDHYFRVLDWDPKFFTFIPSLADAEVGVPYNPVELVNPHTVMSLSSAGAFGVPDGMTFDNKTGVLSGTPTTPGTYTIDITAYPADYIGETTVGTLSITVNPSGTPTVDPVTFVATLADGMVGASYAPTSLLATGAATVTAVNVPAGMTVSTTGELSGTPTLSGVFQIGVTATDDLGGVTSGTIEINIDPDPATAPAVPVAEQGGKITAMGTGYVMLEKTKVSYTAATEIIGTLALEKEILYWGMLNADGTIDATKISVKQD